MRSHSRLYATKTQYRLNRGTKQRPIARLAVRSFGKRLGSLPCRLVIQKNVNSPQVKKCIRKSTTTGNGSSTIWSSSGPIEKLGSGGGAPFSAECPAPFKSLSGAWSGEVCRTAVPDARGSAPREGNGGGLATASLPNLT